MFHLWFLCPVDIETDLLQTVMSEKDVSVYFHLETLTIISICGVTLQLLMALWSFNHTRMLCFGTRPFSTEFYFPAVLFQEHWYYSSSCCKMWTMHSSLNWKALFLRCRVKSAKPWNQKRGNPVRKKSNFIVLISEQVRDYSRNVLVNKKFEVLDRSASVNYQRRQNNTALKIAEIVFHDLSFVFYLVSICDFVSLCLLASRLQKVHFDT